MRTQLKKVIRFYFSAGSLNSALDSLAEGIAASSWRDLYGGEHAFDRVKQIVKVKGELSCFWSRLNGVMEKLPQRDLLTLKQYASLRTGITKLSTNVQRAVKASLIKFRRRAGGVINSCPKAYACVCAYYPLISYNPD